MTSYGQKKRGFYLNACDHNAPTLHTDRETDRLTSRPHSNTAFTGKSSASAVLRRYSL